MKNNIKNMFDSICNEYDFINDIITFRMHRIWKNDIKKLVHVLKPKKILDVATGTADIAIALNDVIDCKIIGIDIHKINLEEKKLNRKNIFIHQGSQSDKKFIDEIIKEYSEFDIIIDDGSHLAKDVKKSFELLFPSLKENGLYVIEDIQTSYNHFFGGNPFDLKYSNSHMNFFKQLTDSLNYQEIANPFYIEKKI